MTPTPVLSQKYCRTNGRRTAVQMGGALQYKWEVYCWASLSSKLRSQEGTAIQMGGVLPYKLEVYCSTFSETSTGWVSQTLLIRNWQWVSLSPVYVFIPSKHEHWHPASQALSHPCTRPVLAQPCPVLDCSSPSPCLPLSDPHTSSSQETWLQQFDIVHVKIGRGRVVKSVQEWPRQTKPKKVSSWTFRRGIPEQKFNVNRACFPKEKHQNSQKNGRNSWTFRFGPFFGLVCRGDSWSVQTAYIVRTSGFTRGICKNRWCH